MWEKGSRTSREREIILHNSYETFLFECDMLGCRASDRLAFYNDYHKTEKWLGFI